jgi:hypothetical protein
MLKGFEDDLAGLELPDEVKSQLIEAANKRASGLVTKNEELLGKLNKNKDAAGDKDAELEKLRQLAANVEQEREESKGNYSKALELKEEQYSKQLEALQSQLTQKDSALTSLLIDDGLSRALDGVNINPSLKAGAEAMLKSQAVLSEGKAMIGDKSLSDAVKEWADSDVGKNYCLAPNNSGGNANGGSNNTSTNYQGKKFSEMSIKEKTAYLASKK